VSVGDRLDDAAAGLARAHALTRQPPTGPGEQAVVAVARTRLYRQLERQVGLLTGADELGPLAVRTAAADPDASPVVGMRARLHLATERTTAAMPTRLPDVPVTGPVGTALHQAAEAVAAANDLLAEHLGDRRRPRTLEGIALAAGHGEADNLAAAARLAVAAGDVDTRLRRDNWLLPGPDAAAWRPLLLAVNDDVHRSTEAGTTIHAQRVATRGAADRAPGRHLETVPLIDDPNRWATVTSARQAVAAMDAARGWLLHHGDQLTAGQIAATARAALVITAHVGHVLVITGPADAPVSDLGRAAARPWREAGLMAAALRSNIPAGADVGTASVAVAAVARWFGKHIRAGQTWRPAQEWAGTDRLGAGWRRTAGQVAARLGDVAELLRAGAEQIQRQGNLLRAGELRRQPGHLVQIPQWAPAPATDPTYRRMLGALTRAAERAQPLADLAGISRPPGRREAAQAAAAQALLTPPAAGRRRSAAHLASEGYADAPQIRPGDAASASPTTATPPPAPGPRRRR